MACSSCSPRNPTGQVHKLVIVTANQTIRKKLCTGCLRQAGFWCEQHGVHVALGHRLRGSTLSCGSACFHCTADEVEQECFETLTEFYEHLHNCLPSELLKRIRHTVTPDRQLDDVEQLVFAWRVIAKLRNTTSDGLMRYLLELEYGTAN